MHRRSKFIAALLTTAAFLQAQAKSDDETTFRADTRLVVLHASVADKNGRLMTQLPRSAFKVFENNVEQPIKMFRREDVPVSLGLVIDNSGSMRDKRRKVETAALAAVQKSNPADEVVVVNFNDEAYDDSQGFTNDIRRLEEALTKIDSRGPTAMRDALSTTIDFVKKKGRHDKKVLLVVTDGNDTASTLVTLEKLVQKAHDSEVLLYFIGILSDEDKREAKKAKRAMEALAKASGGSAVFPETADEVQSIAVSMAHEIRNQYIITYSPTNPSLDGTFRTIRVVANGPNRPVVRTRSGYYATPVGAGSSRESAAVR
ncbi:MAG TPA: VWA domain-containing protein [Bryobacteraceae bacterium]|nr:VWA domain-containing protein [Bryobacteraceae bacterium]